jgi:hypothetical protein
MNEPETKEPEIKPMTVDELATGELPEASEHVVNAPPPEPEPKTAPQAPASAEEAKDASGRKFNPAKHLAGPDGKPLLTDKGYFRIIPKNETGIGNRIKDAYRKLLHRDEPKPEPAPGLEASGVRPGSMFVNPFSRIRAGEPEQSQEAKRKSEAEAAAMQTVAMEEMIAVMVFSEEWVLMDAEKQSLIRAWAKAYEEKGVVEIPWWMELAAAHGVILTSRINKPKTQSAIGKAKGWLAHKFIDLRMHRKSRRVEPVEINPDEAES